MPLNLYRRYRQKCETGRPGEPRSGEFEEQKTGWKKCAGLIFASGTLDGEFRRKCTSKTDWGEARAVAAAWGKAGAWGGKEEPLLPPVEQPVPGRITIDYAIRVLPKNREGAEIAFATLRKYWTFTKQHTGFANSRGYVMLDQFTSGDIDDFSGGWNPCARAKGKRLATLRAFPRFCTKRKWLQENPISVDIKPPMNANCFASKALHTDEGLQRIIDACNKVGEIVWTNEREKGVWTGDVAKGFIWVMVYTGLRISDVGLFNKNRLKGN